MMQARLEHRLNTTSGPAQSRSGISGVLVAGGRPGAGVEGLLRVS